MIINRLNARFSSQALRPQQAIIEDELSALSPPGGVLSTPRPWDLSLLQACDNLS